MTIFKDRQDAGRQLALRMPHFKGRTDLVVLGIPRGGVIVADEVARALGAPLDVLITHKLGAPFNPELAIGAIASDGTFMLDDALVRELQIPAPEIELERARQTRELTRRVQVYRRGRPGVALRDKTVILCDDGIATGSTIRVALRALLNAQPARRILAVPVAPQPVAATLAGECDEMVIVATPEPFLAVGRFYEDFEQVRDGEVISILNGSIPEEGPL